MSADHPIHSRDSLESASGARCSFVSRLQYIEPHDANTKAPVIPGSFANDGALAFDGDALDDMAALFAAHLPEGV